MKCPKCGGPCERDEVDNGVGMQPIGPWGCPNCHWVEEPVHALVRFVAGEIEKKDRERSTIGGDES